MTVRFYSSIAQETTLVGSITNVSTTMTVAAVTGFPSSTPYTLAIDYNTATEELVTVTGTSGTLLTITRGSDGTSAISHNAGAKVRHVSSARDFSDSRSHENATTDIHGVPPGAAIVSTTGTQILSNKTLIAPTTINGATFDNITTGAWIPYSPVWSTTNNPQPSLGAGVLNARYIKIGRAVTIKIYIGTGVGITYGNGAWKFSLPFNAVNTQPIVSGANVAWTGTGMLSGFGPVPMTSVIFTSDLTTVSAWSFNTGAAPVTVAPLDSNFFNVGFNSAELQITYETAT